MLTGFASSVLLFLIFGPPMSGTSAQVGCIAFGTLSVAYFGRWAFAVVRRERQQTCWPYVFAQNLCPILVSLVLRAWIAL